MCVSCPNIFTAFKVTLKHYRCKKKASVITYYGASISGSCIFENSLLNMFTVKSEQYMWCHYLSLILVLSIYVHRCVSALYFLELCENKSQAYYSGGIRTHDFAIVEQCLTLSLFLLLLSVDSNPTVQNPVITSRL